MTEIKDTEKYSSELADIMMWLDAVGERTNGYDQAIQLTPEIIAEAILDKLSSVTDKSIYEQEVISSASLLFLVTGKSDNNCKCQFPIFLRDQIKESTIPAVKKKAGQSSLSKVPIPREIKSTRVAKVVTDLIPFKDEQKRFLEEYIMFILDEPEFLNSFWSIGRSYLSMKEMKLHKEFLMPLVVFKIRGSVSASGGHDPENILRDILTSWGLEAGIDFNTTDVVIGKEGTGKKVKTRAYDFVLPYKVESWDNRIFIQCQFYAGDSGSVSHKNVDQTRTSRDYTKTKFKDPVFIEFLDGAGYFSSLNGDLKTLLSMSDTSDFFQLRTVPMKLRRAFQKIGFLTPLELTHAVVRSENSISSSKDILADEGYSTDEIDRVIAKAIRLGIISINEDQCDISTDFLTTTSSYMLYDLLVNNSNPLSKAEVTGGVVIVPGQETFQGIKFSDIPKLIDQNGGSLKDYFSKSVNLMSELEILSSLRYVINL
ncbi:hypothetical protein [Reichenbachiella sp.]|uniref:hypothetical protein n=1 Tax=Reichenbachiella sp. TaxID=2184521 RepID=UPI003B5979F6